MGFGNVEAMEGDSRFAEDVQAALKRAFRPEFINRIDEIIVFHKLRPEHIERIVDLQVTAVAKRVADKGLRLTLSDDARAWLAKEGYDASFGARPLQRLIQKQIEVPLSKRFIAGDCEDGDVVHVVVDDTPDGGDDAWARERFQRDAIARGLGDCRGWDVVGVSDVDEIPHPDPLAERRLGRYAQVETQYHLDCVQDEEPHHGTVARWWFEVVALGAQRVRDERFALPVVAPGGWHFSCVMPPERISHKLRSYSHTEYDTPEMHGAVAARRAALVDLFGNRPTPLRALVPGDPVLPEVLRTPGHRWSHLMRRGDGDEPPA